MSGSMMVNAKNVAGRRGLRWMVAGVVLAVASTLALSAWAQRGPGGHHGPMGGYGMMFGSPEHVGRGIDRMLEGVNATDAQRAQIKQIALQAATDLKGQRDTTRALREKAAQIFIAPSVDATAAESVRQQLIAQHDASSRRMLQAMLDISAVLTPDQRATLGEQMKQRQQRMQERMQKRQQQPKE